MKTTLLFQILRFVSCTCVTGMLHQFAAAGDVVSSQMKNVNLTRCGIFRGKISLRKINNQNHLEERTLPAPNS
ncbi:MAG TPA: hypothetical protein VFV23_07910 [Verrucomicrobiae bacterium]|nr:hypothetical protein [Verrucomicrobiae bacterium]